MAGTLTATHGDHPRFLQLADVAEILNTSMAQVYALVRRGELPAIKIGGRGQWRVESAELERFIEQMYEQTRSFLAEHPVEQPVEHPHPETDEAEPAPRPHE